MLESFGVLAVAVLLIGIMLILCIDVVRRNHQILYAMTNRSTGHAAEEATPSSELKQVYPSYVDCSRDVEHAYSSDHAADVNALVQKQGA